MHVLFSLSISSIRTGPSLTVEDQSPDPVFTRCHLQDDITVEWRTCRGAVLILGQGSSLIPGCCTLHPNPLNVYQKKRASSMTLTVTTHTNPISISSKAFDPKKQRGCISRQECIIRLPWVDRVRAGYFVSGHTVAFRTFKADMADTLRRLTNTSSFSALQGKLESWHRDYRVSLLILNRRPKSQQRNIR